MISKMKLEVYHDDCASNPREDDNVGTIYYKHRAYSFGENRITDDPIDFLEDFLGQRKRGEYNQMRLLELESILFERYIGHRLYLYEHSGVALSTSPFS